MVEILHLLMGSLSWSCYLQVFVHSRLCRISSINGMNQYDCRFQVDMLKLVPTLFVEDLQLNLDNLKRVRFSFTHSIARSCIHLFSFVYLVLYLFHCIYICTYHWWILMTTFCKHDGWNCLYMFGNDVELYGFLCWDSLNQTIFIHFLQRLWIYTYRYILYSLIWGCIDRSLMVNDGWLWYL